MTSHRKINIPTVLTHIDKHWSQKLVANLNSAFDIKVAKIAGEFIWHDHPDTDELFYVLNGSLNIEMEDPHQDVTLNAGDLFVVPKAIRHRPSSSEGASIMVIEAAGTANTGAEEQSEMTNAVEDVREKTAH